MRRGSKDLLELMGKNMPKYKGSLPVIVDIQGAADYVNALGENTPIDPSRAFPCVRPPWDHSLFICEDRGVPMAWGVSMQHDIVMQCFRLTDDKMAAYEVARSIVSIDEHGGILSAVSEWTYQPVDMASWRHSSSAFCIPLEAMAMCHVKGRIIDGPKNTMPITASAAFGKKRSNYEYHVLRIAAMDRFVADVAHRRHEGKRVHLVRGHYKDFRHGSGVGGNPSARGIYWTPAHVRGDKSKGMVSKDYRL